jgi:hypothetical protein
LFVTCVSLVSNFVSNLLSKLLSSLLTITVDQEKKQLLSDYLTSDAKRNVMRAKKNLKNNVRFVDDITKQNHELMKRMRDYGSVCGQYNIPIKSCLYISKYIFCGI